MEGEENMPQTKKWFFIFITLLFLCFPSFARSECQYEDGCFGFELNPFGETAKDLLINRFEFLKPFGIGLSACNAEQKIDDFFCNWYDVEANLSYGGPQKDALHALIALKFLIDLPREILPGTGELLLGGVFIPESLIHSVIKVMDYINEIKLALGETDLTVNISHWHFPSLMPAQLIKGYLFIYQLAEASCVKNSDCDVATQITIDPVNPPIDWQPFRFKRIEKDPIGWDIRGRTHETFHLPLGVYKVLFLSDDGTAITKVVFPINQTQSSVNLDLEYSVEKPQTPAGLTANVLNNSIRLSWYKNADAVDRYVIRRNFTVIGSVDTHQNTFIDEGIISNTTYWYSVSAENIAGKSDYSAEVSVTTPPGIANVQITGDLRITSPRPAPGPYYLGETLTGEFSIKNIGNSSVTLTDWTIGGRLNGDGNCTNYPGCPDFTHLPTNTTKTINPGVTETYRGTFKPLQSGNYHFFCAYKPQYDEWHGDWNITAPGIIISRDISVSTAPQPPGTVTDYASFVPDTERIQVNPGPLTKVLKIQNTGSTTWTPNYKLVFLRGDQMSGPSYVSLTSNYAPGSTANISINLIVPDTPRTYEEFWRMKNDKGVLFGDEIPIKVEVPTTPQPPSYPSEGDLIRGDGTIWVYLYKYGKRWWVKDEDIFAKMDYQWASVKVLPWNLVSGIPIGPTIVENGTLIRQQGDI